MKNILIVGAGGFAGGFHVDEAIRRGYNVYAGIRQSTSKKYLTNPKINFVYFDFENPDSIAQTLTNALPEGEKFDYIVYNLGATKCLNFSDFSKINYDYLRYFTQALELSGMQPEKFLYVSSLSAMGPGDEKNYTPFTETMIPHPNTRYGASKLKAEVWLQSTTLPYIIFRATGIYGPRDHDYFLMLKSIQTGFDFSVGLREQMLSFIYVADLSRAIFDALEKAPAGNIYNIAYPHTYSQNEFRKIASRLLNKRLVVPMKMPLWAVKAVSVIAEKWGVLTMKPSTLNRDKYNILKQRNWAVDVAKAENDFNFSPQIDLEDGLKLAIDWYKKENWL